MKNKTSAWRWLLNASVCALMLALDAIGYAFLQWQQDASRGLSKAPPRGSAELDAALKRLLDMFDRPSLPKPHPIPYLIDMGASYETIAKKYGWKLPDGSPDVVKVHEELQEPGKHYQPATWVHPSLASLAAEVDRQWERIASRVCHCSS